MVLVLRRELSRVDSVKLNQYSQVEVSEQEAFIALYTQKITTLENVYVDADSIIEQYNNARRLNADRIPDLKKLSNSNVDLKTFDETNQANWFMPDDYCPNLVEILYGMCATPEQTDRVSLELELFIQHNMMDLLYYLKYLVDTMRENNIVWGVGRGSSVASYVLYLLGVHKIDSIKYELDIKEFLK
jgi:DNA polymerase III alpha subunit